MRKLNKLLTGTAMAAVLSFVVLPPVQAGFDEAVQAYEAGDYKKAHDEWLPLAEARDPAAMRNLGHLYRRGLGVEMSFAKALSWYKQAADMGFDRAQANVATMYLKGEGVEQDYSEAAKWFTKAARNGHTIAQYNLGLMYEHGKGVAKSKSKALAWYNLASKAGHKQALNKLSVLVAGNPDVKIQSPDKTGSDKVVAADPAPAKPKPAPPKPVKKPQTVSSKADVKKAEQKPVPSSRPKALAPKAVVADKKPKAEKATPAVAISPKAQTPATETAQKKYDPFAGSANRLPTSGEATVFSKPKQPSAVKKPVETAKQQVAPVKTAEEKPAKKEENKGFFATLKSLVVSEEPEAKTVAPPKTSIGTTVTGETTATKAAAPEPSKPSAPSPATKTAPRPEPAIRPAAIAKATPAPKPAAQPVKQKSAPAPVQATGNGLSLGEQLEMASLAYTLEEYQQALSVWAPLAQNGNAEAQYNLGVMFNEGHAVPVDRVRAYYWWSKARDGGNQKAARSLAELEKTLTFLEKRQLQRTN